MQFSSIIFGVPVVFDVGVAVGVADVVDVDYNVAFVVDGRSVTKE